MQLSSQAETGLSLAQHGLLYRIGHCKGRERVRRLFFERYPHLTYAQWAEQNGFSANTAKAAFSMQRTTGAEIEAVRDCFAQAVGLPVHLVFVGR